MSEKRLQTLAFLIGLIGRIRPILLEKGRMK